MKEYQGFAISNARTGFDQAVEPWLLPRDGYQQVENAHLYRGVLEKINGYTLFAPFTNRITVNLMPDGINNTFTGTLTSIPKTTIIIAYGSIVVGTSAEKFTYSGDASASVVNLTGSAGGTGTIDLSNGNYSITFNTIPPGTTYSVAYIQYDGLPASASAIMGIKQYYASNGSQQVLVFDTKRVGKIISVSGIIAGSTYGIGVLQAVEEIPHDYYQYNLFTPNGATLTFTTPGNATALAGIPIIPGTISIQQFSALNVPTALVITDNGFGALQGTNVDSTVSFVNYITGAYTITFTVGHAPAAGTYFSSKNDTFGNLFTGTFSNFFSLTNYMYYAFFTNNVDPIFYYDGTYVHYLTTNLTANKLITSSMGAPIYDISKCLHVFTYRERLLLISPTVLGALLQSTIYWSAQLQPLVFTNNEFEMADTSQAIRAIGLINTDLVVRFSNSESVFRWTGDDTAPFRFDGTNNIWACDAPYSTISYDTWFSTVGRPAIVGSDAVNVKRVDEIIPDITDPTFLSQQTPVNFINQTSIAQCYGERFDDEKEGWLCYNSSPEAQTMVYPSDNVLAFNYLDSTYATYTFPFSCLGFGRIVNVPTWSTTFTEWQFNMETWGSFEIQSNALIDLAGDQYDRVYELNIGSTQTAAGDPTCTPIPLLMSVITKNFNPFIEQGQLARLGYIDLLVSANAETKLRVQFFLNDELYTDPFGNPAGYYQESMIQFIPFDAMSPVRPQVKVWKRIYVGAVGKEHTVRVYQNEADYTDLTVEQSVYIHAMVLYFKPAGRIFN